MKRYASLLLSLLLTLSLLTGCGGTEVPEETHSPEPTTAVTQAPELSPDPTAEPTPVPTPEALPTPAPEPAAFDMSMVPPYSGRAYVEINGNVPFFTPDEHTTESYEYYSPLDRLGRCGVTVASIGRDLMPTEPRGEIGSVKPTGWHTVKYDCVDGKYLYNRCHLIGFQLTGENANKQNLVTGTRYMNVQGMLPIEDLVADYVQSTGFHVMYRVTPIFDGDNLVCDGVLMEAISVEDSGRGLKTCVFAYNVQPGVVINYATGESCLEGSTEEVPQETNAEVTYVLNTNSHKFHDPGCSSVSDMKPQNRQDYTGTREDLIAQGYEPCGRCHP